MRFLGWLRPNPAKRFNKNHLRVRIGYGFFKSEKEVIKAFFKAFPILTKAEIISAISHTDIRGGSGNAFTMFYPELKYTKEVEGIEIYRITGNDETRSDYCNCEGWYGCCRTLRFTSNYTEVYSLQKVHPKYVTLKEGPFPPSYQKGRHIQEEHPTFVLDEEDSKWMEVHYGC